MYGTYSQEYRLRQYNEIYEKRHKRLEERIAQLEPAEQPEAETEAPEADDINETPEADEPEEAVTYPADEIVADPAKEATEEAEAIQLDPTEEIVAEPTDEATDEAEDAPQEIGTDTEEAAA